MVDAGWRFTAPRVPVTVGPSARRIFVASTISAEPEPPCVVRQQGPNGPYVISRTIPILLRMKSIYYTVRMFIHLTILTVKLTVWAAKVLVELLKVVIATSIALFALGAVLSGKTKARRARRAKL
jgi:hypothetical protein